METSDGGAFYVENRSTVIFSVPMTFDSNSVFSRFSGGGVYSAGKVRGVPADLILALVNYCLLN